MYEGAHSDHGYGSIASCFCWDTSYMRVSDHEDNSGALVLAETLPPQFTPRSKYYATKTIQFWEEIHKWGIKLLKIETSEQLGDMFTKGLALPTFEYL